jgi:hypothetical protein
MHQNKRRYIPEDSNHHSDHGRTSTLTAKKENQYKSVHIRLLLVFSHVWTSRRVEIGHRMH